MKPLVLLLVLLAWPAIAGAQETEAPEGTVVKHAEVSGLDFGRLSPGLRQSIEALNGKPLNRKEVSELATRIEQEHPDVVVAFRAIAQGGESRVVFLVARIDQHPKLEANINSRYVVESVDITGAPDDRVNPELRDDLQKLVGNQLDPDEADRLNRRLETALPGHDVRRRISRGSVRGRIRVLFEVTEGESLRWLHFTPSRSKLIVHDEQGWSGVLDIPIGGRDHRVTLNLVGSNADDLIEEYSGFGIRLESRRVVSERLGFGLELSRMGQSWEQVTLDAVAADPRIPQAYETRTTITPLVTFALTRHVRVSGGISASELEPLEELESAADSVDERMTTSLLAGLAYEQHWEGSPSSHSLAVAFALRSATDALASDLVYKRYFGQASYEYRRGRSAILVSGLAGRTTGEPPLFERFALGDSLTLRGWDKYAIAPAGAERMLHGSVEYRHSVFAVFLDAGSLWNRDTDRKVRTSTGFGIQVAGAFLTLAFPLNDDELETTFMMGVRF
jgi:hypothetical protein